MKDESVVFRRETVSVEYECVKELPGSDWKKKPGAEPLQVDWLATFNLGCRPTDIQMTSLKRTYPWPI